jgi:ribonuclease HI
VTKTVVPGDSFADLMMRIMISPMIAVLRRRCPSCLPAIVVDDIQCLVHGMCPAVVGRTAAQLMEVSILTLETELHLPVSRPKLMSVVSGPEVRAAACAESALVSKSLCPAVRNLGVDFSASGRKSRVVRRKRLSVMKARAFRLRRLSRSNRSKRFLTNGIGAVAVFGGGITGFTRSDLKALRSSFRSCLRDKAVGRSLAWDLHHSSCDPALMAIDMAVRLFLVAWHTALLPKNFIRAIFDAIHRSPVALTKEGPVAAFVNTIRLVGWDLVGNRQLRLDDNRLVDIDDFLPWEASVALPFAVNRTLWIQAAEHRQLYHHLDHQPYTAGISSALKLCTPREAHLVDGFMAGCYSGACKCYCGFDFEHEQRLWWHIWWDCPISDERRRGFVSPSISRTARRDFSPWMATALFPHPFVDFPPPSAVPLTTWCWKNTRTSIAGSPLFGIESFSDGSTFRPNCKFSARSGWAVIQISGDGTLGISAYGCLPLWIQDNNAAEIWCIRFWLLHLDPGVHSAVLYSDSQVAVDGFLNLLGVTAADQPYASVWRSIANAVSELGGVTLKVIKVPAHISIEAAAARGAQGLHRRAGNRWADLLAKAGSRLHPDSPACHRRKARIDGLLREIVPWFGRCLALLVDFAMLPSRPPPSKYGRLLGLRRHMVVPFLAHQERCCRCLRVAHGGVVAGPVCPRQSGRTTSAPSVDRTVLVGPLSWPRVVVDPPCLPTLRADAAPTVSVWGCTLSAGSRLGICPWTSGRAAWR